MPIKFRCPHCRQKLEVSSKKAGVKLDCPACGKSIRIPTMEEINDSLKDKVAQAPVAMQQDNPELKEQKLAKNVSPAPENSIPSNSSKTVSNKADKPPIPAPKSIKPTSPLKDFSYEESQPLPVSQIRNQLTAPAVGPISSTSTAEKPEITKLPAVDNSQANTGVKQHLTPELASWNDLLAEESDKAMPDSADGQTQLQYQSDTSLKGQLDELFEDEELIDNSIADNKGLLNSSTQSSHGLASEHPSIQPIASDTDESSKTPEKAITKRKNIVIPTTLREWSEDDEDDEYVKKSIPAQEDMDLTPMVDVTFLLLIFFMLTASFSIQKSIPIPNPNPQGKGAVQSVSIEDLEKDSILITITAENKILVDDVELSNSDGLSTEIIKASNNGEKIEVVIQPDPSALHEYTVKAIDAANEAGIQKIRLADADES